MDRRDERMQESVRRVLNNLTAAKASAQLLERLADGLPDGNRERWVTRLRAIVTAVNLASIEVERVREAAGDGPRDP